MEFSNSLPFDSSRSINLHLKLCKLTPVINHIIPETKLEKKCNSIAFHKAREAVLAARKTRITDMMSKENIADLFTKSLTAVK